MMTTVQMPVTKARGQVEAEIAEAIVRLERELMGRGPTEAKAHIIDDLVVVRLRGVLTPPERRIRASEEGRHLIRATREQVRRAAAVEIERELSAITGSQVASQYWDLDIDRETLVEVFELESNLERRFLRQELDSFHPPQARRRAEQTPVAGRDTLARHHRATGGDRSSGGLVAPPQRALPCRYLVRYAQSVLIRSPPDAAEAGVAGCFFPQALAATRQFDGDSTR